MPSLGQLYNDKDAGLTTRKTYNVPLDKIYAEEGYNVRELNQAHVEEFRDAFIAGEYIPPLAVEVTERGVKVIDGHHRYHGALAAIEMGHDIVRLECKDFVGSEADKIAFMVTSSQGLRLLHLNVVRHIIAFKIRGGVHQKLRQKLNVLSQISFSTSSFTNALRISKSSFVMVQ
jgi:ParB family chromosome partitioning protein